MIIEDKKHIVSVMNNRKFEVAEFAHQFRCQLYKEHFGLNEKEIVDPISDEFWEQMQSIARVIQPVLNIPE